MLRQLFIKPDPSGLENGGLVPYFQVVSLGLFTMIMIDYRFRSKKEKKKLWKPNGSSKLNKKPEV
jgi:hypothetical protein